MNNHNNLYKKLNDWEETKYSDELIQALIAERSEAGCDVAQAMIAYNQMIDERIKLAQQGWDEEQLRNQQLESEASALLFIDALASEITALKAELDKYRWKLNSELPKKDGIYLVYADNDSVPIVAQGYRHPSRWIWWDISMEIDLTDSVCYWMESPKSPLIDMEP